MIHLVDHKNIALYEKNMGNAEDYFRGALQYIGADPHSIVYSGEGIPASFTFAIRLHKSEQISECLLGGPAHEALAFEATSTHLRDSLPADAWFCAPVRPRHGDANRPLQASARLWVAALEQAVQGGDRVVATVMDRWRCAVALKAGMPWRELADIDGRWVLAGMDVSRCLIERLADRFALPAPYAYRVDEGDLAIWGSLRRIEQEFDALRRLIATQPAGRRPAVSDGRN